MRTANEVIKFCANHYAHADIREMARRAVIESYRVERQFFGYGGPIMSEAKTNAVLESLGIPPLLADVDPYVVWEVMSLMAKCVRDVAVHSKHVWHSPSIWCNNLYIGVWLSKMDAVCIDTSVINESLGTGNVKNEQGYSILEFKFMYGPDAILSYRAIRRGFELISDSGAYARVYLAVDASGRIAHYVSRLEVHGNLMVSEYVTSAGMLRIETLSTTTVRLGETSGTVRGESIVSAAGEVMGSLFLRDGVVNIEIAERAFRLANNEAFE